MGLDNSQVMCCIDGCESFGAHADPMTNRLYCSYHWQEECRECNQPPCDGKGCEYPGRITDPDGKHWCTEEHAWKMHRFDSAGLRHPPVFTDLDIEFTKSLGIMLDGDDRDKKEK
jgi:hypothetical protein